MRTEEEFFHTFNALYESGRQLVITSDRKPRDLDGLEARLQERFECGLVAELEPPDFEAREAILRKRVLRTTSRRSPTRPSRSVAGTSTRASARSRAR